MTFYTYMTRNFIDESSPAGDLARDIKRDKEIFPRNGKGKFIAWHREIRSYLTRQGACDNCTDVFEDCWRRYEECERKKSNKCL